MSNYWDLGGGRGRRQSRAAQRFDEENFDAPAVATASYATGRTPSTQLSPERRRAALLGEDDGGGKRPGGGARARPSQRRRLSHDMSDGDDEDLAPTVAGYPPTRPAANDGATAAAGDPAVPTTRGHGASTGAGQPPAPSVDDGGTAAAVWGSVNSPTRGQATATAVHPPFQPAAYNGMTALAMGTTISPPHGQAPLPRGPSGIAAAVAARGPAIESVEFKREFYEWQRAVGDEEEDATEETFRDECAEEMTLVGGVLMSPESEASGRLDFVHSVYKSTNAPFVGKYIGFVGDIATAGDIPYPMSCNPRTRGSGRR